MPLFTLTLNSLWIPRKGLISLCLIWCVIFNFLCAYLVRKVRQSQIWKPKQTHLINALENILKTLFCYNLTSWFKDNPQLKVFTFNWDLCNLNQKLFRLHRQAIMFLKVSDYQTSFENKFGFSVSMGSLVSQWGTAQNGSTQKSETVPE